MNRGQLISLASVSARITDGAAVVNTGSASLIIINKQTSESRRVRKNFCFESFLCYHFDSGEKVSKLTSKIEMISFIVYLVGKCMQQRRAKVCHLIFALVRRSSCNCRPPCLPDGVVLPRHSRAREGQTWHWLNKACAISAYQG